MVTRYIIDGSNLANDGGSSKATKPVFGRIKSAVESLRAEHPNAEFTVLTDASLLPQLNHLDQMDFNAAALVREIFPAPSGTLGRGDAWVMAAARKARSAGEAVILVTNDSLTEFQDSDPWIFESGAIIGGHDIGGLGWVWVNRVPVDKRDKATVTVKQTQKLAEVVVTPEEPSVATEDEELVPPSITDTVTPNLPSSELPRQGSIVEGRVTGVADYGAFILAEGSFTGLIHHSTFPAGFQKADSKLYFHNRQTFFSMVKGRRGNRLELSYRDALLPPTEEGFDPQTYGLVTETNEHGDISPIGWDAEHEVWLPGYEEHQARYEAAYQKAEEKWRRHLSWMESPQAHIFDVLPAGNEPEPELIEKG